MRYGMHEGRELPFSMRILAFLASLVCTAWRGGRGWKQEFHDCIRLMKALCPAKAESYEFH